MRTVEHDVRQGSQEKEEGDEAEASQPSRAPDTFTTRKHVGK
jgi:hypothetical protein